MGTPPGNRKKQILFVDDELPVLQASIRLLKILGYRVLSAQSGREACRIYGEKRDQIDLVILDVVMPEMNGEATYAGLQQLDPAVAVLLTSGLRRESRAVQGLLREGAKGFLAKPFTLKDLGDAVSRALVAQK
jgi:DNA-binding NtrC family response regulator